MPDMIPGVEPVEIYARLVYFKQIKITDCPADLRQAIRDNLKAIGCIELIDND